MNREMASVYTSFSYSSLTTNLRYTVVHTYYTVVHTYVIPIHLNRERASVYSSLTTNLKYTVSNSNNDVRNLIDIVLYTYICYTPNL